MVRHLQEMSWPEGVTVTILAPASTPPYFLLSIRALMQAEGSLPQLFWHDAGVPDHQKGSPETCLAWWTKALCFVVRQEDDILGLLWATEMVPRESAHVHVWYRRRASLGFSTALVSHNVLRWAFVALGWERVWCEVITPAAANHARALGGQLWATIPQYVQYRGRLRDVMIYRVTPEDLSDV
jgi:hypothetical protein